MNDRERMERMLSDVERLEILGDDLPEFTTWEQYEDVVWDIHVAMNQLRNAARLSKYGAAVVNTTSSPMTSSPSFLEACGAMLRAEKRELQHGTAKIKSYTSQ